MSKRDEWKKHLTPELRQHFDDVGYEAVKSDLTNRKYSKIEKQLAALYWVNEEDDLRVAKETNRFRWLMTVGTASVVVSLIGIAVAVWMNK